MSASTITLLRFVLAALTLLALAIKPYIPPKKLPVYPDPHAVASIYAPPGTVYGDHYAWTKTGGDKWRCRFDHTFGPLTCGWSLDWNLSFDGRCAGGGGYPKCSSPEMDDDSDGWGWEHGRACVVVLPSGGPLPDHPQSRKSLPYPAPIASNCTEEMLAGEFEPPTSDFSAYNGIYIQVHYEGKAEFLRLYMRNFSPAYSDPADVNSTKFMSTFLRTDELKAGPMYISFAELKVAEWWVLLRLKQNADRQLAMPEFDRIVSLGIDHVEHGVHKMRIERVELVGKRITTPLYLTLILLIWVIYFGVEWSLRAGRRRTPAVPQAIPSGNSAAEERADVGLKLGKTPAITDPTTGAYNRGGVEQQIGAWYAAATFPPAFAVIMLEVDQCRQIRESLGQSAFDQLLRSFVELVEANTREQDILARWDESAFVLLSRQTSVESLLLMVEKLRQRIASQTLEAAGEATITASFGITIVCPGDTFHMALKRAEIAMHKAKSGGNGVVYEE